MILVAIISGKGGSGKTTCCMGIARALNSLGYQAAILDLDLENPSIGTACGLSREDLTFSGDYIVPPSWFGVPVMSLSLFPLLDFTDTPLLVDEERKHEIIGQLFKEVDWGKTEVLLVDMPPGSGEEVRGLLELGPDSAIVVTTPQRISEAAVAKVIQMANEYAIPILGIVENNLNNVPGSAGQNLSEKYHIRIVGTIPWDVKIAQAMEDAKPLPIEHFLMAADTVVARLAKELDSKNGHKAGDPPPYLLHNGSPTSQPVGSVGPGQEESPGG